MDELRDELKAIVAAMKAITDAAGDDTMTVEQANEFDRLKAEWESTNSKIEVAERKADLAAVEQATDASIGRRTTAPRITGGERTDAYMQTGGFKSLGDFARSVRAAGPDKPTDPRMSEWLKAAPSNYHQEGVGADGGFAVPGGYVQGIWSVVFDEGDILGFMNPEPTEFNTITETIDESTPWATSSAVRAQWRAEAAQMSATKSVLKEVDVKLHELYAFVLATDELLSDAPRLENHLTLKAGEAIRYVAGDAIVNGDGVGKPLGFHNHASQVEQAAITQSADTIVAANVTAMFARCLNVGQAAWFINPDAWQQLPLMTIGDQPVWTAPNQGMKDTPGGRLLGLPVIMTDTCQTVGDAGDIQLVSPAGYLALNKRGGTSFASSIHLYFDYGMQAFRWTFRLGGQPRMSAAVTPPNSSVTRSHFVELAARAG